MRDDLDAIAAPLSARSATRRITLAVAAATNVTPTQLKPGYYQCRVANGAADETVTGKLLAAATAVADSTLGLPAADAAEVEGLFAAPADAWFLLSVEPEAPYLAAIWDGAADSELILTRVYP